MASEEIPSNAAPSANTPRALSRTHDQQPQVLQAHGLQRQPLFVVQPHFCSVLISLQSVISGLLFALLQASESPYNLRTMVRSQALQSLTIGRLATAGGVGVETVRFYQRRGLLETPVRDGIRRYGSDDLRRLKFIRQAQAAGFTLEEIKELLDLDASED